MVNRQNSNGDKLFDLQINQIFSNGFNEKIDLRL